MTTDTDREDREEAIRARAHEIWEREGRPEGAEARHWEEARLAIEAEEEIGAAEARGDIAPTSDPAILGDPAGAHPPMEGGILDDADAPEEAEDRR